MMSILETSTFWLTLFAAATGFIVSIVLDFITRKASNKNQVSQEKELEASEYHASKDHSARLMIKITSIKYSIFLIIAILLLAFAFLKLTYKLSDDDLLKISQNEEHCISKKLFHIIRYNSEKGFSGVYLADVKEARDKCEKERKKNNLMKQAMILKPEKTERQINTPNP